MNNWRLLLFAVVAILLPVGSFTERNLFDGREQCCDHRSDFQEARLYGTYRKGFQEDRHLSTRLPADRFDVHDTRRHETRYGDPLTHSSSGQRVSVERRFTELEWSVRNQERQQRNLPESRLSQIGTRRDLTRNDRESLDYTRRNTLDDIRSESRIQDVDLNRNSRTENERRMSARTERNEIKKVSKPTEESIRHELRLKNERVVLRLRENMRDSRHFRTSEERRQFRQMSSNAERRQANQLKLLKKSVEKRDTRNVERVARDELQRKRVDRAMQFNRLQQQRVDNRQLRDREFPMLRESLRRVEQRRFSRDPLDLETLRMREIRSLERLERVRDSRDARIQARSNQRLDPTSERSRLSEDRMSRLSSERRITNARNQMERIHSHSYEERPETRRMSRDDSTRVAKIVQARVGVQEERTQDEVRGIIREMRERSDIRNSQNSEMARDRVVYDRPENRETSSSLERSRNLEARNTLSSVRNIRNIEREVPRNRRSVDDRSDSRRESRERSSLERNRNLEARNTPSSVRNIRNIEHEVTRDRRSVDDRSDSRRESRERSNLERSRNLKARNTPSSVRNIRNIEREVTRDRRSVDDRSDSRRESRERSSLERSRNLEARSTSSSVRNIEREVPRNRRSVDDRSDSRRESRERSSLERNRNLEARSTPSSVRNIEREVPRNRRSVDDRSDSRRESRERSSLERSRNLEARSTPSKVRNIEREVPRNQRSVDDRSDSRRESRERSSLERSRNLEARNTPSSVRNIRNIEREVTRDRRSVDDRSNSRRESRERSTLERSRNLEARNTPSSVRNIERDVTRDRRSVDNRSDSRRESRERSSLERSRNSEARNTPSAVQNIRNIKREVPRDRRSVDDRSNSHRESRERSTLERSRNLEARNTLSSVRTIEREVTRDRRSIDDRSDSHRESRERSTLERSRNFEARNRLSSVRKIEREVTRDRQSIDYKFHSRRELQLNRERSSPELNRNLVARNTLSANLNVRENQRKVVKDQRSVDRIDSRRVKTILNRSRSLEARNGVETRNRAVYYEEHIQRKHNERSMAIRPQIDRFAMKQNDRTTEFRNGILADDFRIRENVMINEKTEIQDGTYWEYMFYTLHGAYLCGLLVQMLTEKSMKSKTRNFSWWPTTANSLIKVD